MIYKIFGVLGLICLAFFVDKYPGFVPWIVLGFFTIIIFSFLVMTFVATMETLRKCGGE